MENIAIKGTGGNDVQHKNWKGKILRIWITIIRHGGLGHEVEESWPYLSGRARESHLIDNNDNNIDNLLCKSYGKGYGHLLLMYQLRKTFC